MQKKISKQLINEQYDFVCFELDIAKDVTANTKELVVIPVTDLLRGLRM